MPDPLKRYSPVYQIGAGAPGLLSPPQLRAYDRLSARLGVHDHGQLLSQLWGVDVVPFPAEVATINLFRQRVSDAYNFPRILNEDFFDIVPEGSYRFPPLTSEEANNWIDEPIPEFAAIVGNFPYIDASRIDRRIRGYRDIVDDRLAQDWFQAYADGFTFKRKTDAKEHRLARENNMDVGDFQEKAESIISTYADLYVYLFWHAAAFVEEGGRMGIATSNAWLDVGYGCGLQRFILDHFKIVAVLESRCEPWFLQAAVNTVVTIVERRSDPAERDAHPARFVKVKRSLEEVIPWDLRLDALKRWTGLDGLVQRIEGVWQASDEPDKPITDEDDDFRIRTVRQGVLRSQVEAAEQTVKWGPYLRAPEVYFDLLREGGERLALLRDVARPARGGTTRINDFFYVDEATIRQWDIEPELCWTLIKSPGETTTIHIDPNDLSLRAFVCRRTKNELKAEGTLGSLRYVEWGEQQAYTRGVHRGLRWPEGRWVKDRQPGWYALPESETHFGHLFISMAYGERHLNKYSPEPLIADNRLYFLSPVHGVSNLLTAAVMNSSITALLTELAGRVTMGDGALELKVKDARDYLHVPDVRQFDPEERQAVVDAFQPLLTRPIGSVFDEIKRSDRRALDEAVLRAMGLHPDEWLPRLYDGLRTLVRTVYTELAAHGRPLHCTVLARMIADRHPHLDVSPRGIAAIMSAHPDRFERLRPGVYRCRRRRR